mmetsp:Transcript_62384/g.135446  ORF Transcript_62384/g.135446 Transcript_62384/m.135446 type:complete len:208 (-) Transcript_62384:592-1215(-)
MQGRRPHHALCALCRDGAARDPWGHSCWSHAIVVRIAVRPLHNGHLEPRVAVRRLRRPHQQRASAGLKLRRQLRRRVLRRRQLKRTVKRPRLVVWSSHLLVERLGLNRSRRLRRRPSVHRNWRHAALVFRRSLRSHGCRAVSTGSAWRHGPLLWLHSLTVSGLHGLQHCQRHSRRKRWRQRCCQHGRRRHRGYHVACRWHGRWRTRA